jgi:hypothetical protein
VPVDQLKVAEELVSLLLGVGDVSVAMLVVTAEVTVELLLSAAVMVCAPAASRKASEKKQLVLNFMTDFISDHLLYDLLLL